MKKYKYIVSLLIVLSACSASAFQLKSLVGSWSGKYVAKEEGEIADKHGFAMEGEKLPDGSVVLIERSLHVVVAKHKFLTSGKYSANASGNTLSGNWKMSGGQIVISGNYVNPGGKGKFTGSFALPDKNHFKYTVKLSSLTGNFTAERL